LPAQDGYVTYAEANCFLSYVAPLMTAQERETALKAHDDVMVFDLTLRQTVSAHGREAFVAMLAETLDGLPRESVVQGANNFVNALALFARRNVNRWHAWAKWVDEVSALTLPTTFMSLLLILFELDMSDEYVPSKGKPGSWSRIVTKDPGKSNMTMSATGVVVVLVIPMIVLLFVCVFKGSRRVSDRLRLVESKMMASNRARAERERKMEQAATHMRRRLSSTKILSSTRIVGGAVQIAPYQQQPWTHPAAKAAAANKDSVEAMLKVAPIP